MRRTLGFFVGLAIALGSVGLTSPASAVTDAECNRVSFTYSYNVSPYTARAGQAVAIGTNSTDLTCKAYTSQQQANVTYGQAGNGEFNFLVFGSDVGTTPCQYDVYVNNRIWVSGQTSYAPGTPGVQQSDVNITKLNRERLKTLLQVGSNEFRVVPFCPSYAAANAVTLRATVYTPDPSYSDSPGITINKGSVFALDRKVTVYLSFAGRISQYVISNYPDFRNSSTRLANYKHNDIEWTLPKSTDGYSKKYVYVKYRYWADADGLIPGAWSDTVYQDEIILDDIGPKVTYGLASKATGLWDLNMAVGTAKTKLRRFIIRGNDIASQVDKMQFSFNKSARGVKTFDYTDNFVILLPAKVSHVHVRLRDVNGNWGPWRFVKAK